MTNDERIPNDKTECQSGASSYLSFGLGYPFVIPRSGQGEAGFDGAAGGAFQAADAAGDVDLLVHFHAHRTAAAAEVALDAFLGIEPEMEQAEPVEQREQTAQRTKNAAPRTVNEKRGGEEEPAECPS